MTNSTKITIDHLPHSPLGPVWVATSRLGLWALEFQVSRQDFLETTKKRGKIILSPETYRNETSIKQIAQYLKGERRGFDLKIDWRGMTEFQILVRKTVMSIPSGETTSYSEIAIKIGRQNAVRAVGGANATNPIPLVIPCHRVLGKDGALTGYGGAGGIQTKLWLLNLEKGVR